MNHPIVVNLDRFDPTRRLPGWDGQQPSQQVFEKFPKNRDVKVIGHRSRTWTGGGFIGGGRNVRWEGGAYSKSVMALKFTGNISVEGVLVRPRFVGSGVESGDGLVICPDSSTLGTSDITILNCRVEHIDGFYSGSHGDIFQLASSYTPPNGFSSCPRTVWIERLTGSTGYQGLFLPNQHFDDLGYQISCRSLTLLDVNLFKTRLHSLLSPGVTNEKAAVNLIYLVDTWTANRGDKAYPKTFTNVYVEPFGSEGLDGCIYPNTVPSGSNNSALGARYRPTFADGGRVATYPAAAMLDGEIKLGKPPGGDFARRATRRNRGGMDVPGIGYRSPGYR